MGTLELSSNRDVTLVCLSAIGLAWYCILFSFGLLGCYTARKRYRLRPRSPLASLPPSSVPGVSILRPLKGLDTNLYENLESTFTQEYPNFEILLSVADERDQALAVVRDLIYKYPNVNAEVIVGDEVVGVNPKVNNLIRSYRRATNDILWVLDSGVSVAPGTLGRSVDALVGPPPSSPSQRRKRVALVHHVPFAFAGEFKFGSRMEEAFLNTNHAKMYLAINTVAIESCVVGKSNLYRRSDLERVNGSLKRIAPGASDGRQMGECGLAVFGKFLAEDNMIGSALWHELGQRHELSCDVARNAVGNMTLSDYVWRRIRWIRVRKHMVLAATLVEPLTECIVISSMAAACLNHLCGFPPWIFLLVHFAVWLSIDLDVYASLAGHPLPASQRWQFLGAWLAREALALPIWVFAIFGDEVVWRGKSYQVHRNGEVRGASSNGHGGIGSWFKRRRNLEDYEPLELARD